MSKMVIKTVTATVWFKGYKGKDDWGKPLETLQETFVGLRPNFFKNKDWAFKSFKKRLQDSDYFVYQILGYEHEHEEWE